MIILISFFEGFAQNPLLFIFCIAFIVIVLRAILKKMFEENKPVNNVKNVDWSERDFGDTEDPILNIHKRYNDDLYLSSLLTKDVNSDKGEKKNDVDRNNNGSTLVYNSEIKSDSNELQFVNYNVTVKDRNEEYPKLYVPSFNCIIRTPSIVTVEREYIGLVENILFKAIEKAYSKDFDITNRAIINTGKLMKPYILEIAMMSRLDTNLKLNVEVDEPYSLITRNPKHFDTIDLNRDLYLKNRGWSVIRFSEIQAFNQTQSCLNFIGRFIKYVDNSFVVPEKILGIDKMKSVSAWSLMDCQKMEKANYRESYLGQTEKVIDNIPFNYIGNISNTELEEERHVDHSYLGEIDDAEYVHFNKTNKHQRDSRVKFYPLKHYYTIDGAPATSVSDVYNRYFNEFDRITHAKKVAQNNNSTVEEVIDKWESSGKEARDMGTLMHQEIEQFFLSKKESNTKEFQLFKQFYDTLSNYEAYRTEWRIFDEETRVAGTIDLLTKEGNSFCIYDWKRSKNIIDSQGEIIKESPYGNIGLSVLSHLSDTSFIKYSIQQSIYRLILEKNYNIKVSNAFLVVLHPNENKPYCLEVPYYKEEAIKMIELAN